MYINFAEKVETIVKSGLNKVNVEEFKKYDFSVLGDFLVKTTSNPLNPEELLKYFDPSSDEFSDILTYVSEIVKKKDIDSLEYDYVVKNMDYLVNHYDELIQDFDNYLPKFKFFELESVTQSILLLMKTESVVFSTPKAVLIKEADLLASTFTSDSNIGLIHALLDKVL